MITLSFAKVKGILSKRLTTCSNCRNAPGPLPCGECSARDAQEIVALLLDVEQAVKAERKSVLSAFHFMRVKIPSGVFECYGLAKETFEALRGKE